MVIMADILSPKGFRLTFTWAIRALLCDPVPQELRHWLSAKSTGMNGREVFWPERPKEKVRQAVSIYMTMSVLLTHSTCTS